jgi:YkoY family integral membrane protein
MFNQTFEARDLIVIGVLMALEGVLSLDNALVLGLLARRWPRRLQSRALMYGLVGALAFRIVAIALAGFVLRWQVPKLLGGIYLVYVAIKHFAISENASDVQRHKHASVHDASEASELAILSRRFWMTVLSIELTDIAFAVDSIVAAMALISTSQPSTQGVNPKLWLVVVGGMMGVILMRFAAVGFIRLLRQFPRLETSAYLLVFVIGGKLILDYCFNAGAGRHRLDFQSINAPGFWIFWMLMLICFLAGFIPRADDEAAASAEK